MPAVASPAADLVGSILAIPRLEAADFERLCVPLEEEAARYSPVELENALALLALARTLGAVSEHDVCKAMNAVRPHRALRHLVQRALNGISRALIERAHAVSPHAGKQGFELGLDLVYGMLHLSTSGVIYYDISSLDIESEDIACMTYQAFMHLGMLCPAMMSHHFYELGNFPMYAEAQNEYNMLISSGVADDSSKAGEYIVAHEDRFEVIHQMGGLDEMLDLMGIAKSGPPAYIRQALSAKQGVSQSLHRFNAWQELYPLAAKRPWARWTGKALALVDALTQHGKLAKRLSDAFVYDGNADYSFLPLPDGLMVSRDTLLEHTLATDRHESAMSAGEAFMVSLPLASKDTPHALVALVCALALYIDGAMIGAAQPKLSASHS